MSVYYEKYEVLVKRINLPNRNLPNNIVVCNLSGKSDFNIFFDLFLKIFPDEIDTEKAMTFREFKDTEFEGIFIAKLNQDIIGFLITGISDLIAYILYIGVLEEYRGLGISTALLKKFLLYLKIKKIQKIQCKIRKDNRKTLGYIKYLGFNLL